MPCSAISFRVPSNTTRIPVREQVEVVSLLGDVALDENAKPSLTRTSSSATRTAPRWAVTSSKVM
jgi:hypothetical protein